MGKDREPIPKGVREEVLKEYSHSCAICGRREPQLHHIDEDPSNNDPMNLLPICPNHHLTDQHNPTRTIDTGILNLFRKWKDPAMLSPEFSVLFKRLRPLYEDEASYSNLAGAMNDLTSFIKHLEHGEYFARQISNLVPHGVYVGTLSLGPEPAHERQARREREERRRREQDEKYRRQLLSNRERIEELVAEVVKFQGWELEDPDDAMNPKGSR